MKVLTVEHCNSGMRLHVCFATGLHGGCAEEAGGCQVADTPEHDELCQREQALLLAAIREDHDLARHWQDAIDSLRIVLAADESIHSGETISLAL